MPRLIGCAPHLDYEILVDRDMTFARSLAKVEQEARKIDDTAIYGQCCMFQPTGYDLERCLGFLQHLKSCTSLCPRCCMNIPYVVERIRQDAEREQRFDAFGLQKSGAMLPLYRVLADGWGVQIDRRLHLDITRSFCEWIEENLDYDCTGWWDVVLDLACDGLDARGSRHVVLRTLWKERQASIERARQAFALVEWSMHHQYGVPRDVRRLICRKAGAYTRTTWMHWSERLLSLFVLWGKKQAAINACNDARYALNTCMVILCRARDHNYRVISTMVQNVSDDGTGLYSRSAWLHWVDTGVSACVLPDADIGLPAGHTESDKQHGH